jgi:SNF2 family DNA or RNA helicase
MIDRVNRIDEPDSSDLEVVNSGSKSFQSTDAKQYIDGKELNLSLLCLCLHSLDTLKPTSQASSTESDEGLPDGPPKPRKSNHDKPRKGHVSGDKVEWSSDADPQAAYLAFKNRKSLKRKRAVAESRRARASVADKSTKAKASEAIVGRRRNEPEKSRKKKSFGDERDGESDGLDVDQLEEKLPDYIQSRKTKFEKMREKLGDAGLKMPPSYEDIYFSDNELKEQLRQKPVLATLKPCAPYKDIILEYSAGVIPATLAQWLRDYQVKGVEFLHELFVYQRGGILGDDMGLGKTIQVIAFLTAAFGKTGDERDAKRMRKMRRASDDNWYPRVLIICPGGLMNNWRSELERWGWWQVYVYHGSVAEKEAAIQAASKGRLEIMITTYTTYRTNMSIINTVDWDCVVADECHAIKVRSSETTKALNDINALCRIGLTGTAIQNNYDELWTLLNWTNPGRFGSLASWRACISEPLRIGQAHDATIPELAKARKIAEMLVHNLLPQFFLRRMKSLIADQLPKKSDRVVFCPLTDTQADAYENFVSSDVIEYIKNSNEPCSCGSGMKQGWCCAAVIPDRGKWQVHVFPAIVTLQKISNHLALLIPLSTAPKEQQDKDLDNLQVAVPDQWKELYRQKDSIMNFANQEFCGKWKVLKRLLQFWYAGGDKVLVFSHSVRLLKMLQILFTSTTSYNVSYLDGSMSYEERSRTVDDFNANPSQFVFLISTRAGGVGLNITSANKVVVVDPNWNPSYDLQAQDRAYRIGQTRDVEVFRLVSAGTIEEIVYARQIYKQQQANIGYNASLERRYFRGVQDQKEKKGEIFGLANLFAYQGDHVVLREIVNKTNVAESKAGVLVAGLDMTHVEEDNEDPIGNNDEGTTSQDAAMSQLAEFIVSGGEAKQRKTTASKKADPVQAILAAAGVEYTHENTEVIGTSKVESNLSRRAMARLHDVNVVNEPIFSASQSQHANVTRSEGEADTMFDDEDDSSEPNLKHVKFKYRPPVDVRRRQFCTMAQTFGFTDATEFALVVEGWTQEQRRNCLEKFYKARRKKIFSSDSDITRDANEEPKL